MQGEFESKVAEWLSEAGVRGKSGYAVADWNVTPEENALVEGGAYLKAVQEG